LFNIYKLCGAAIIALVISIVLKNRSSSLSPYLTQITAITIAVSVISSLYPLVSFIKGLIGGGSFQYNMFDLLIKATMIAIICQVVYDICKENGENMLASVIEFAGNAEIMLLSLPLINTLLKDAFEALNV
jgi:stage III sporulation protein AD